MNNIFAFALILAVAFSSFFAISQETPGHFQPERQAYSLAMYVEGTYHGVSNISNSVPESAIVSREIAYINEIPVLFESYVQDGILIDVVSLLENTQYGYRVVECGEDLQLATTSDLESQHAVDDFFDQLLSIHNEMRQIGQEQSVVSSHFSGSGHHNISADDGGPFHAPIRVQHWFDWSWRSLILGSNVWIGSGGLRATSLTISPVAILTLNENVIVNRLAWSASLPPGFGPFPNAGSFSVSHFNVLLVSASRGSFTNEWFVPTFGAPLVTIETTAGSFVQVHPGVIQQTGSASIRKTFQQFAIVRDDE